MAKLNVSRRTFVKMTAATAAVAAIGATAGSALAEEPYTAADSAGQVRRIRTCCRGCGKMECGVWVTVENGRAVKIEGDESAPAFHGKLLREVGVVDPGVLPPRPPALPYEAHPAQG